MDITEANSGFAALFDTKRPVAENAGPSSTVDQEISRYAQQDQMVIDDEIRVQNERFQKMNIMDVEESFTEPTKAKI